MAYTYDPIFAADPSNSANVAANASIIIFDPADSGKAPITITDVTGAALPNPITVNKNGFGPAFQHATLDRVGWFGAGFTGYFTSYEGMKAVAVEAAASAQAAAGTAGTEAAAVATAAIGTATDDAEAAAASAATAASNASASATAAANAAALVGAPADSAVQTLINAGGSATRAALNATYASTEKLRGGIPVWAPNTAYVAGAPVIAPDGSQVIALTAFTSGATYDAANWSANKGYITMAGTKPGTIPVLKTLADTRSAVWEFIHNGGTGYLWHLLAGADSLSGAWMFGIGLDAGFGNGIIVRNKSKGIGLKLEQVFSISSATAYGLAVEQKNALAPAVHMELKGAGVNNDLKPADLMEMFSYWNDDAVAIQKWYSFGATAGSVLAGSGKLRWDKSVDIVGDVLNVRNYDTVPAPARKHIKTAPTTGSTWWSPTGTDNLWYGFRQNSGGSYFNLSTAAASANPDAATYVDIIKMRHNQIGFFSTTPISQKARLGALTDSSGGTSGGATVGAVMDVATAANAIATLAAKINAIEATLSAAGGGYGLTL